MPDKYTRGWERGREMRNWRHRKGGLKARDAEFLHTRLGQLVGEWLKDQRRKGLSAGTAETRRLHLRRFLQWCWMRKVTEPEWLSVGLMQEWVDWMEVYRTRKQTPLAPASKEGMMRAVNTFMAFLLDRRLIEANPLEGFRIRRCRGRPMPNVMGEDEVAALLAAPDSRDLLGVRDRAMLELLYSSGMRRGELAQLQVKDLRLGNGVVVVRHGKGGRERIVPLGKVATFWLKRYLSEARPEIMVPEDECDYVFLTCYGGAFSPTSLGQLVRKYLNEIGVKMTGACHLLRHACATHMLDHGSDLRTLQTLLGHARIDTTEIYTHVSTERMCAVHHEAHPRG